MAQADKLVRPEDVAAVLVAALKLPARATVSEIEIRPTDPRLERSSEFRHRGAETQRRSARCLRVSVANYARMPFTS